MTQPSETNDKGGIPATKVDLAMFLQSTGVIKSAERIMTAHLNDLQAPAQRPVGPDLAMFFSINPAVRRSFVNRFVVELLVGPLTEAGVECPEITGIQPQKKTVEKSTPTATQPKKRRVA